MTEPQATPPAPTRKESIAKPAPSRTAASRLFSAVQLPLAILITLGVLAYLLWPEGHGPEAEKAPPEVEVVKAVGLHRLAIAAGTPLEKKLEVGPVVRQETRAPRLNVTGAVVARVPPSNGQEEMGLEGRWDFNTPDLASAYADWLKARADVPFYEKQYEDIQKLAAETLKAKKDVRDRLEKLVKAGTDPEKDLAAAKADYLQAMAQSQKDEHEALTNVNNAKRTLATLERQLFQAGMDPELLANPTESTAIVAAEVPESRIGLAEKGQDCQVKFSAIQGKSFPGRVRSLAPTISKERRTLRVFFQLADPQGELKPGMFADISLGTDLRKTLRIAADGVLHVGQSDYVLVQTKGGDWKVTKIVTGEQYGKRIEVLDGLQDGDRVIGAGAILLKPYVVQDVQAAADAAAAASSPLPPGQTDNDAGTLGRGDGGLGTAPGVPPCAAVPLAPGQTTGGGRSSLILHPTSFIAYPLLSQVTDERERPCQSPAGGSAGR